MLGYMHMYMYMHMFICVCIYMYVCMYVCMCVYTYYIHIYIYIYIYILGPGGWLCRGRNGNTIFYSTFPTKAKAGAGTKKAVSSVTGVGGLGCGAGGRAGAAIFSAFPKEATQLARSHKEPLLAPTKRGWQMHLTYMYIYA